MRRRYWFAPISLFIAGCPATLSDNFRIASREAGVDAMVGGEAGASVPDGACVGDCDGGGTTNGDGASGDAATSGGPDGAGGDAAEAGAQDACAPNGTGATGMLGCQSGPRVVTYRPPCYAEAL